MYPHTFRPSHHFPARLLAALCVTSGIIACAGPVQFSGKTAMVVNGTPPPPAKPEEQPRVEVRENKIVINEKIQFDYDKAIIKPVSFSLLKEVADVIRKNPQIKKIAIEGHASAEGSAAHNLDLSDRRAKAVMKHLIGEGIAKEMLTASGYGSTRPLADNETEPGRETNRRVEFNIVEQETTQQKVVIDPKTGKEQVTQ